MLEVGETKELPLSSERLLAAKDVNVEIFIETKEGVLKPKYFGILQGISINVMQQVERAVVIGSEASVPYAGYYSVQIGARKFFIYPSDKQNKDMFESTINLQDPNLINPIPFLIFRMSDPETGKISHFCCQNVYWTSHSITVQTGQILVMEEVTFECEDFFIS